MEYWPEKIRFLSIPSVVCCTLFAWNAVFFLIFSRLLPGRDGGMRRVYLYFALTSFLLAVYTFGSINLYSSTRFEAAVFWQKWQFVAAISLFASFVKFSTAQLKISHPYWIWGVPILSLLFLPFVFWNGLFVQELPAHKTIGFWGYQIVILEGSLGPLAEAFIVWFLPHVFYLGWRWMRTFRNKPYQYLVPLAFFIFAAAAVNDVLVANEVYRFFYLLELAFVVFIVAMSLRMFREYVEKSREVDRLHEEMRFLLGAISHDFLSPLLSIDGFSDRVRSFSEGEPQIRHCVDRIQANSSHMRDLVTDVSDFLRIGRVREDVAPTDAGEVAEAACNLLDISRHYPHAALELPAAWPTVQASAKRLKQVFANLLQNALKYSPPDKSRIRIRWEEAGKGVVFFVEDEGPGISADLSAKIFEPFFRGERGQPGSGLGLAIVRKALETMGGRVWLDYEYTDGARFCFWLPASAMTN